MKKIFFPALLFVAAMSSCSQNDVDMASITDSDAIGDEITANIVAAGSAMRGAVITTSSLEDSAGGVDLYIKDSGSINAAHNFMADVNNDWSQSSTNLKWNDLTFPVHFFSAHDGAPQTLTVGAGNATLSYTVEDESTNHKDLVYHASTLSAIPASGAVNAYHQHALSKISLRAGTGDNKLYVAKVTLMNVDGKGTATIDPDGIAWANSGDAAFEFDHEYYPIANTTIPVELQSTTDAITMETTNPLINSDPNASFMIIPQTVTAASMSGTVNGGSSTLTETYIEVIYYLTDKDDNPLVGYSAVSEMPNHLDFVGGDQAKTLYVKAAFPLGKEFVDNKQYTLTLGMGMTGSTGGKLVDDFYVDADGDPVDLTRVSDGGKDKDIPGLKPGDDILGGSDKLIDIMVSVGGWGDEEVVSLL